MAKFGYKMKELRPYDHIPSHFDCYDAKSFFSMNLDRQDAPTT